MASGSEGPLNVRVWQLLLGHATVDPRARSSSSRRESAVVQYELRYLT